MSRLHEARDVRTLAGITYRQLDHWTHRGYLTPTDNPHPGTGTHRTYDDHQLAIAVQLGALTNAGIPVPAAVDLAHQILATGHARLGDYLLTPTNTRPALSTTTSTGAAA